MVGNQQLSHWEAYRRTVEEIGSDILMAEMFDGNENAWDVSKANAWLGLLR